MTEDPGAPTRALARAAELLEIAAILRHVIVDNCAGWISVA